MLDRGQECIAHAMLRTADGHSGVCLPLEKLLQRPENRTLASTGRIAVRDVREQTLRVITVGDIVMAERDGRRVRIQTRTHSYVVGTSVNRLSGALTSTGFFQTSRSVIVNLAFIDHLVPNGDGSYDAIMADDEHTAVKLSRGRSRDVLAMLEL